MGSRSSPWMAARSRPDFETGENQLGTPSAALVGGRRRRVSARRACVVAVYDIPSRRAYRGGPWIAIRPFRQKICVATAYEIFLAQTGMAARAGCLPKINIKDLTVVPWADFRDRGWEPCCSREPQFHFPEVIPREMVATQCRASSAGDVAARCDVSRLNRLLDSIKSICSQIIMRGIDGMLLS